MGSLTAALPQERIVALCRKWKVRELALFGSALRPDFRLVSDVDVLVDFEEEAPWSLWDLLDMRAELRDIFGREVDLVEQRSLQNPYRRRAILRSKQVICSSSSRPSCGDSGGWRRPAGG
jgi:predicted nucleotidyltransferase